LQRQHDISHIDDHPDDGHKVRNILSMKIYIVGRLKLLILHCGYIFIQGVHENWLLC